MQIDLFPTIIIPILIFLSRIVDVSLGTLRIILVARDLRIYATVIGFVEVLVWLLAIGQIMSNLTDWVNYVAYSAGFASGTFVGMTIERRLSIGKVIVRAIVPFNAEELINGLIKRRYRFTYTDAHGSSGPVKIIFTVVNRANLTKIIAAIREFDPGAFFTVEDVRLARLEPPSPHWSPRWHYWLQPFYWFRKSK